MVHAITRFLKGLACTNPDYLILKELSHRHPSVPISGGELRQKLPVYLSSSFFYLSCAFLMDDGLIEAIDSSRVIEGRILYIRYFKITEKGLALLTRKE